MLVQMKKTAYRYAQHHDLGSVILYDMDTAHRLAPAITANRFFRRRTAHVPATRLAYKNPTTGDGFTLQLLAKCLAPRFHCRSPSHGPEVTALVSFSLADFPAPLLGALRAAAIWHCRTSTQLLFGCCAQSCSIGFPRALSAFPCMGPGAFFAGSWCPATRDSWKLLRARRRKNTYRSAPAPATWTSSRSLVSGRRLVYVASFSPTTPRVILGFSARTILLAPRHAHFLALVYRYRFSSTPGICTFFGQFRRSF